jgi:hypothetical protein
MAGWSPRSALGSNTRKHVVLNGKQSVTLAFAISHKQLYQRTALYLATQKLPPGNRVLRIQQDQMHWMT